MIGIPRALFYYYDTDLILNFFKELGVNVIISNKTTKKTIELGSKYAQSEMCLALKNYIGHVYELKEKADYILIPRIDNYYTFNQTCTNFLAARDIVANIFDINVLDYNIDLNNSNTLKKGLYKIANKLNIESNRISKAYSIAYKKSKENRDKIIRENLNKLQSKKKKVLIISHNYNTYDNLIGVPIINMLRKENIEIIYSDRFDINKSIKICENKYKDIYWKYSKEMIGAYEICKDKIDGIVLISTFPCGLDSLANELLISQLKLPYLNIIIDDINGDAGIETRVESFIDILKNYN